MRYPMLVLWGLLGLVCTVAAAPSRPETPLVIAHRGASGYLPEHTLAAKAYAYALGAPYLEQDVVLSKDGVPIVLHDIHLETVTDVASRFPDRSRADGRYYALDFTVAELKQLRVHERRRSGGGRQVYPERYPSADQPSEFRIPTFEEELQLIQGLNRSTGRQVGIYPEIKQPSWHRAQGADPSTAVIALLHRYGYTTKQDPCFVQCFEVTEIRRIREELGWKGRLVQLIGSGVREADGTDNAHLCTDAGLSELAPVVDGIGPAIERLVTWTFTGRRETSTLTARAHAQGLVVHPYTVRRDDLPRHCRSLDELHEALFTDARVDGVFTDFPDLTLAALRER